MGLDNGVRDAMKVGGNTAVIARISVGLVGLIGIGCGGCQATLVDWFSPTYSAPDLGATGGGSPPLSPTAGGAFKWVPQVGGFHRPTDVQFLPGSSSEALVSDKRGDLWKVDLNTKNSEKIHSFPVNKTSEMGLLGLAFHPRYPVDNRLFVQRSPKGVSQTLVSSFRLDWRRGKLSDERGVLRLEQPYPNHNGGQLQFGPDGMLYIGLGDGGWRGDKAGNGQNKKTLLGAMLRLDIDDVPAGSGYRIPPDNPFVHDPSARPELFAIGLRNPWRFAFAADGRLIVADVGQDAFEEVSVVPAGANMGWPITEGGACFSPSSGCKTAGLTPPFVTYGRTMGTSITGGVVVRGSELPGLSGRYLYADFTSGRLWSVALPQAGEAVTPTLHGRFSRLISAFGQAADGAIYAVDFARGELLRLHPASARGSSPPQR
jgi:glucose/arabinose dehydrogenase